MIIPNTPHYNSLLWEVKHLIRLKPLKFPNGIPTEEDIGFIKIDIKTGELLINPSYKLSDQNLEKADSPPIYQGKYLREYLKWASGLLNNSLPSLDVQHLDGMKIKDFDRKMKDYYKHQHTFYSKNER